MAWVVAGGMVAVALTFGLGAVAERIFLGADAAAARQRLEAEVRGDFDALAGQLRAMATPLSRPDLLMRARAGDTPARRSLFDLAETATSGEEGESAVTVFGGDGQPVAWGGQPSDLPADRVAGPEAWFVVQGALGLRLVYVRPLAEGAERVGAVVSERLIPSDREDPFTYPTTFGTVGIQLTFETATRAPDTFLVNGPSGDPLLSVTLSAADVARTRARWQTATRSVALIVIAITVVLLCGPLIDWRNAAARPAPYLASVFATGALIAIARLILRLASPADWSSATVLSATQYASPLLPPLLTSPFDLLTTAMAFGGLVAVGFFAVEGWRLAFRQRRRSLSSPGSRVLYVAGHLAAGTAAAIILNAHFAFIRDTVENATVDLLHFSLHPFDLARISLQVGLVLWHAAMLGAAVLVLRAAAVPWRVRRHDAATIVGTAVLWCAPTVLWLLGDPARFGERASLLIALIVLAIVSVYGTRLKARYRHGSQAFRLVMLTVGLLLPTLAFYPSLFTLAWAAKATLVESRFAPQALAQRQTIQRLLQESLAQIDSFPGLPDLVAANAPTANAEELTDRAYQVWRITGLAAYPVTSSIELYGSDARLISRFAFNLPDDLSAALRADETSCSWEIFEEVSPFFAEERRVLHAGRALCVPEAGGGTRTVGAVVVHTTLDYANLRFIASQNPYVVLLGPSESTTEEGVSGRDVQYVVYGWSRTPLYTGGHTAWQIDDETFERIAASRDPFWAKLKAGDSTSDVYLMNDRGGIYALGFPVVSVLGHLVNIAELTVLAVLTYVLLLGLGLIFAMLSRRRTSARALLREVRASFYRKLFLAFVAAAVVPVVILAVLTRNYVATQMEEAVEQEAIRTATAARRVVEDLVAPRATQQGAPVDDNLMVWVSRLIDQDVNIFRGSRLQATSERNLFASGLLPRRTPADVYRGLLLRNEASTVARQQLGSLQYIVAGTPVTARQMDAMLTIPLTSRQREIEAQIDLLNRQVLLGALLFILAGAGLGYSLAERIADPVNRLTRATARISRGELDIRIAATSSDELRRLVHDFNSMAEELQRQRQELERTHRLEAWAEMSRQVAHDIKNPLTPIQLNAEHLRRVHADRGRPLSPILDECVDNILTQVRLLRQIASEFSSFASSPTAKAAAVNVAALLHEIIDPYVTGLRDRIEFRIEVPHDLPPAVADRSLVARALTNIIENALHAMPERGTLTLVARPDAARTIRITVGDSGRGMDAEALSRAFEPYFSTKATGTGLGLPIAKRNIELNGGTIAIHSSPAGTTVEVTLPQSPVPAEQRL